ncbi:hypothetical protein BGZ94_006392, partial [Podila epigama]
VTRGNVVDEKGLVDTGVSVDVVEGEDSGNDDIESSEGEQSEEEEVGDATEDDSRYSKHTIKGYAQFRLLGPDRRWGRNIKFILMMFDWIQKNAIFGYQMRMASARTEGRATRARDILERTNDGA